MFEIGDEFCRGIGSCIGDEPFDVYLATDIDCGKNGAARDDCQHLLGTGAGESSFTVIGFQTETHGFGSKSSDEAIAGPWFRHPPPGASGIRSR